MALLNEADALYMGDLEVDAVYVGDVQVWPTGDAWSFYRELTISNTGGAAKSDWPVRVDLTGVTGDGTDLQFRAADGVTVLDHWVEAWPVCWVNVPTIGANTTATVRAYYGNDAAVDTSDGAAVFPTLFEDFDDPDALTTSPADHPAPVIGNWYRFPQIAAATTSESWRAKTIYENSKIIYDPDDSDPDRRFKFYLTGANTSDQANMGVFFSPDGETFTPYGSNPVLADKDDLAWVRNGSTVHVFVEDGGVPGAAGVVIRRYTTSDGVTFSDQGVAIPRGTGSDWDRDRVGSPTIADRPGGGWVMMYDGSDGTTQKIGVATSSDLSTWTKGSNNPLITVASDAVPMELWQADGVWWCLIYSNSLAYLYRCDVADPTAWTSSDWTNAFASDMATCEGTLAPVDGTDHKDWTLSYIFSGTPADNFVRRCSFLGTDEVTFGRWASSRKTAEDRPYDAWIEAHSDTLVMVGPVTGAQSMFARWSKALTDGWAVCVKMKKEVSFIGEAYARLSVGAGATVSASSNAQWAAPTNAYSVLFGASGTASTQIQRVSSGTATTLGSAFTVSDYANYHTFELRYSGNTLSFVRDNSVVTTRTDSNHAALSKDVMITQGQSNSGQGAKSTWDFVFARPFDGVDPSVSVGSETAT